MSDSSAPTPQPPFPRQFDKLTRLASENLARRVERRVFLKRVGGSAFGFLAALASGQVLFGAPQATTAEAGPFVRPTPAPQGSDAFITPNCAPPGFYCNLSGINQPDGCHGGHCYQHLYQGQVISCNIWYCCYQAGCWTTAGSGGFWTCCDCECGGGVTHCGCAQFSAAPFTDVN